MPWNHDKSQNQPGAWSQRVPTLIPQVSGWVGVLKGDPWLSMSLAYLIVTIDNKEVVTFHQFDP